MLSRSIMDNSRSVNDTSKVIRMMIVCDATTYAQANVIKLFTDLSYTS
jgi:hypothetical protein